MAGATTAPWLDRARDAIGTREIKGSEHNPLIVSWGKEAGIGWWNNDEDAWCAVAMNGWLVEAGYPSTKSALARSFTRYGTRLAKVVPGAIVVFPRTRNPMFGHVAVVEKVHGDGTMTTIDGNVSDQVKRVKRRVDSVLSDGIRWPPGAPLPPGAEAVGRVVATDDDPHALGDRILRRGSSGVDVEELQAGLAELGFMAHNDPDVHVFGPGTEDALRAAQRAWGIEIDGVFGTASGASLTAALKAKRERKAKTEEVVKVGGTGALVGAVGVAAAAQDIASALSGLGELPVAILIGTALIIVGFYGYRLFKPWIRRKLVVTA